MRDRLRKRKRRVAAAIDRPGGFQLDAIDLTIDEEEEEEGDKAGPDKDPLERFYTPGAGIARGGAAMNASGTRSRHTVRPKPTDAGGDSDAGWKSASSSDAKRESAGLRYSSSVNGSTPTSRKLRSKSQQPLPPPVPLSGPTRLVAKLRQLVRGCVKRHHAAAALYYADKLVCTGF